MAMFIEQNNNPRQTYTARKGDKIPPEMWRIATAVYADNEELEVIESNFTGIHSMRNSKTLTLVGLDAKHVVANWNNLK